MAANEIGKSMTLISLSAQESDWWKKAGPARRKAYIEKHPNSKYANGVKSGKLKINEPKKPKAKPSNKTTRKAARPKSKPVKPAKKEQLPKSREIRAQEAAIVQEENDRLEVNAPAVRMDMKENFKKIKDSFTKVVQVMDSKFSPQGRREFNGFAGKVLKGKYSAKDAQDSDRRGGRSALKLLDAVNENTLGQGRWKKIGKSVSKVLLSAFLGPSNYKDLQEYSKQKLESNSVSRLFTPQDEYKQDFDAWLDSVSLSRWSSLSAEEPEPEEEEYEEDLSDPETNPTMERFVQHYMDWLTGIDFDTLSKKIGLLEIRHDMEQEKFVPSKEAVDKFLEDDKEEYIDIPGELDSLDSESATRPRISFRVCPTQRKLTDAERTKYDILYGGDHIGRIESDPKIKGTGANTRSWVAKLYDGFNESAFRTGRSDREPYTVVSANQLSLINPIRQTYSECCNWVKHTINRNML